MTIRLVALDEGPDISVDHAMVVVGRHPQCDARLDSIRVSRRHCCMTPDQGELVVRDLGSTNGIRINGQRVEMGRLRPGDELSIAHIRYRLDDGSSLEKTLRAASDQLEDGHGVPYQAHTPPRGEPIVTDASSSDDLRDSKHDAFAAAVRELLPTSLAKQCRIQVIVQMQAEPDHHTGDVSEPCRPD